MTFSKLEKNLIDVIKEEQVKLGYRSETIRLYYPILSLNRLLGTDCEVKQMTDILNSFCDHVEPKLGRIEISDREERFCFTISAQGAEYVHKHMDDKEFIVDLVNTISKHGVTMDEVLQQFYKYSDEVHIEKVSHGEFDYLVYFENGKPDDFRYCITDEGCHIIYHRFTVDDYNDFYQRRER
ncbi:MAG: DUF3877 family protein [Acetatifactor sp.]|nr:DUF3877 family protein [Acetatifactor sp.]